MKKLLIILFAVTSIAGISCTKHYLAKDMLTYEVSGQESSIDYYSNTSKSVKTEMLGYKTWRYTEVVGPGDSVGIFIIDRSIARTTLKIYLGASVLYEGKTGDTGLLFINYKFHQEDFRLK